jgi:ABC-2 type transport system ATP-binding protein
LVLQVASVAKRYGQLPALSDVSFTIRPGEVLGLIGPNGSGKTTLFECLGGVLPADAGGVLREGRPLTAAERTGTIFYLPDAITPWPTQSVRWALRFVLGYWGGPFVTGQTRDNSQAICHGSDPIQDGGPTVRANPDPIQDVVQRLDLGSLLDAQLRTLSKGQRKRALLAIGLLTPQPILLADEPFDGLDLKQTREVGATLRHFAAAGRTMILSIHQIADAARVCDRFVLLSGGRVRGEGTLEQLSALAGTRGARAADLEEVFLALT